MGGASSREKGQVCYVTLPQDEVGANTITALALVPFIKHYFPTPESLQPLHDLYCQDTVKATFLSGLPRKRLHDYYEAIVMAGEATHAASGARNVPIATLILARHGTTGKWSVLGYLSWRSYNVRGVTGTLGTVGMFKTYTGSATGVDVAVAAIRAGLAQYYVLSQGDSSAWPQKLDFTFDLHNSGTASLLTRMFELIALRNPTVDPCVALGDDPCDSNKYKFETTNTAWLRSVCDSIARDPCLATATVPSLKDVDEGRLWKAVWALAEAPGDEPCVHVDIKPSPNDKGAVELATIEMSAGMRRLHQQLQLVHEACKKRAAEQHELQAFDQAVMDLLISGFGLQEGTPAQRLAVLEKVDFLVLVTLPNDRLQTPAKCKNSVICDVARALPRHRYYEDLFENDEENTKGQQMQQCAAKCPLLVVPMLLEWRSRQKTWEVLLQSILDVVAKQYGSCNTDPQLVFNRIVDLRRRRLVQMSPKTMVEVLKAAWPQLPLDDGMLGRLVGFREDHDS